MEADAARRTTRSVSRAPTDGVIPTCARTLGTYLPPSSQCLNVRALTLSRYLDVGGGKDLWFSFFESRGDPATDPVIMWINGGPGCSSALGLLMELGPCSVADDPKTSNDTKVNPYSWNNNANIFFLDEPVNVGFSKARHGQVVGTAEEAGQDIAAFVSIVRDCLF